MNLQKIDGADHKQPRVDYSTVYPGQEGQVELTGAPGAYQLHDNRRLVTLDINNMAATIWQLCNRDFTVDDIVEGLAEAYKKPPDAVYGDVITILNQYSEQYIIRLYQDCYQPGFETENGVSYHAIPSPLHDLLEEYRQLTLGLYPKIRDATAPPVDHHALQAAMAGKITRAADGKHCDLKLVRIEGIDELINNISKELDTMFSPLGVKRINSGRMLYGGNSWMGWHTNEDLPGRRIYLNWSKNEDENDFRYLDSDRGEIITTPEPAGWSMKSFHVPTPPQQLWHCINAGGKRIALGFAEFRYKHVKKLSSRNTT